MKEIEVDEDYQIRETTQALEQITHEKFCTKITDQNGVYLTSKTIKQLLTWACYEGCSTLEGRRKAVTHALGFNQKIPLPLNIGKRIYACPTCSPDHPDCVWIFFTHVHGLVSLDKQTTLIRFKDNGKVIVPVSQYTIEEQQKRTMLVMMRFSGFDKLA